MFLWAERPGRSASFSPGGMTDSSRLNSKMITSLGAAAANDRGSAAQSLQWCCWRAGSGGGEEVRVNEEGERAKLR